MSYLEVCNTKLPLPVTLAQYLMYALIHPPCLPDPLQREQKPETFYSKTGYSSFYSLKNLTEPYFK